MMLVISLLIAFVGIGFPILFEYVRNKKDAEIRENIEENKQKLKNFEESVEQINSKNKQLKEEFVIFRDNLNKEYEEQQLILLESIKEILLSVDENENDTDETTPTTSLVDDEIIKIEKSLSNDLSISINGQIISGGTVKEFYRNVFQYLISQNINFYESGPYATGPVRYLINTKNNHKNGNKFTSPILITDDYGNKFYVETHKSKLSAYNDIVNYLNRIKGLDIVPVHEQLHHSL